MAITNPKTVDDTSSSKYDAFEESESVGLDQHSKDLQMGGNDACIVVEQNLTDVPRNLNAKYVRKSSNQPQCIKLMNDQKSIFKK